jgi:tetratricopeptide (TPR) repeat protein
MDQELRVFPRASNTGAASHFNDNEWAAARFEQHEERVPSMDLPATIADFNFRAFIAYSHQDEVWAKWLQKALETYRVPSRLVGMKTGIGPIPRRLAPIFRDRSELPTAPDLDCKVNEALDQSANLIVICSPRSATSHYVNEEIISFKRLAKADRIFCLIVDGEPNATDLAGRETEECFAPALRFTFGPDGMPTQRHTAPIAADARQGRDGKTNAKLKLIAGMLDIGFDALKQREHHRHMQRLLVVTSAALVAMLITTGLAIDAVIAGKASERRQKQAELLVDFMLGDLNDKLGQVQRLDILEATDNQAMKYFQSLPTTDVTDQVLALRAKALQKIGSIRMSQGNIPAALESYRAAWVLAGELVRRAPGNPEVRVAYADSFKWIGNAYWYQGDLDRSLENFQQAIVLLEKAAAEMPQDPEVAFSLASARTNAGRVFEAHGEYAQAQTLYEHVRQTFEALRLREPQKVRWQTELGDAYDNLGKLALEEGDLVHAVAAYRDDQRIKAALAAADPKNYDAQENLLVSDAILGRTLVLCGAHEVSMRYARDAVNLAKDLVAFDSTQTYWREDFAYYGQLLGGMLRQSGRLDEASRLDNDAVRVLDELVVTDKTNARWRRELGVAQLEAARLQIARGDYDAADQRLTGAFATINLARATSPSDLNLILLAANADIVGGQIAARHGNSNSARDFWTRARDTVAPLAHVGDDPNVLSAWASALLLLDDLDAARPVLQKLAAIGYRTPDFDALLARKKVSYAVDTDVARRIVLAAAETS